MEPMDEMQEIIQDFLIETKELISALDNDLVDLEKAQVEEETRDGLNAIFRAVHTIKGASGFLGFNQLVDVCHKTETLLNKLRHGEMKLSVHIMDVILDAIDVVKALLIKVENNDSTEYPLESILRSLNDILEGKEAPADEKKEAPSDEVKEIAEPQKSVEEALAMIADQIQAPKPEAPKPEAPKPESKKPEAPKKDFKADQTIRIDTERLDDVMNLVGELVLERNRLIRIVKEMQEKFEDQEDLSPLSATGARINLLTTDLQMSVMKTRMQPVKKVFNKFPRMVRDLKRSTGKDMELILEGEDTELDKSIIEEISDPLVHLVRNSCDHGIELPDERERQGKSRTGIVKLSAYHEGDQIVIEIADDGKGIDVEKVKAKAVNNGILGQADVDKISDKEALNLIFAPGFSTAEKVTDLSGRGVGMDVVKTNIANLNGIVDVETKVGKGSKFSLKLPLTVAIIQSLIVGTGDEVFAIPLASVLETMRISKPDIRTINEREVISLRDGVLSLMRLSEEFDIPSAEDHDSMYVVVIGLAEKRVGVVVEKLFGQEEVVIKPLGHYLSDIDAVSGATVTGDGKVVLILDIATMIQKQMDIVSV